MRHCRDHMLGETLMGAVGSGTDKTQNHFFFVLGPLSAQYPMTGLSVLQLCGVRDRHSPSLGLSEHKVRGFCRLQRVRRGCATQTDIWETVVPLLREGTV